MCKNQLPGIKIHHKHEDVLTIHLHVKIPKLHTAGKKSIHGLGESYCLNSLVQHASRFYENFKLFQAIGSYKPDFLKETRKKVSHLHLFCSPEAR